MAERVRVIGLGNPDRGDDGLGPAVSTHLKGLVPDGVDVISHSGMVSGLLDAMEGTEAVYLVDAARSGAALGFIHRLDASAEPLPALRNETSSHGFGLANAVELARALGQLPRRCIVYAVEGACFELGAQLSPAVAQAVSETAGKILEELNEYHAGNASLIPAYAATTQSRNRVGPYKRSVAGSSTRT